jgi:hypothetical protein
MDTIPSRSIYQWVYLPAELSTAGNATAEIGTSRNIHILIPADLPVMNRPDILLTLVLEVLKVII